MSREQNQHLISLINSGGLFFIEGTKVHVIPLYRGDGRVPEVILPEGFACRGTNPNLQAHVNDGARQSIYISTSQSQDVATSFAEKNCHGKKSFIYEINPQKTGIDVLKSLKDDIKAGKTCDYVTEHALAEKEVAVPHKIAGKDIKGVWVLESNTQTGSITKTFVKNPAYVAPLAKTAGVLGTAGKTMTGVAAAMDVVNLSYAFFDSVEAGNYERFFNEGARIAGGWSAAIAAGAACGQMGALWLAPLGPVASLAGGIVCGAIGSIVAYHAGGALAQEVQTLISRALREEKFVLNQFQSEIASHNAMYYVEAIFKGNIVTAEDLHIITQARLHPDQYAIIPMTELMKDAVLLAIGEPAGNIVLQLEYRRALEGMKNRTENFTCSIEKFKENVQSELDPKKEPRIFVPGEFLIAAKNCSSLQTTRTLFRTARIDPLPPKLQFFNLADIRADNTELNNYIYVIDKNMKLHIGYGQERLDGRIKIYHSQIANNQSVYAAGTFLTANGKITQITNVSGHYKPRGEHLHNLVESVFLKHGFYEAPGLFVHLTFGMPGFAYARKALPQSGAVKTVERATVISEAQKKSQLAVENAALLAQIAQTKRDQAKIALEAASRIADASRIKADNSLRAAGLLTADGLLKDKLVPTQLTSSSSFSDAFIAIKNVGNNLELKKHENWPKYSKELRALEDYIFNKVGRHLPLLRFIIKANPGISTADEFYAVAKHYLTGDKTEKHLSVDSLRTAIELNPNHDNALCLLGLIAFNQTIGTQETKEAGIEYLKRAREKGNAAATTMMQKIDEVHDAQMCHTSWQTKWGIMPFMLEKFMKNIQAKVLSGEFNLIEKGFSRAQFAANSSSQGSASVDSDGGRGDCREWGARGGSDIFGGSNSANTGRSIDMQCWRDSAQDTTWHCNDYRTGESYDTNTP